MTDKIYLIPLWLRLWHWINALLMLALIVSGVSLHFAAPGSALISFSLARDIHNAAGMMMAVAYAAFAAGCVVTGNWREYAPHAADFQKRLVAQTRYYLWDMFRGRPNPHRPTPEAKFNALQSIIYGAVMFGLMPVLMASGLLFLWPELAPDSLFGIDGLLPVALTHYVAGFLLTLFALSHIYLATMGRTPSALTRTMITGWHES